MNMESLKKISIVFVLILIVLSTASVSGYYILNESLVEIKYENKQLTTDLKNTQIELGQVKNSLTENLSELEELRSGDRYEMHDPTYGEVVNFIRDDKTNKIPYDDETFVCGDYASIVNNNAESLGMRCAFVTLTFNQTAHTIIGFNTTNTGMVYIEPQSDEWVRNLEVGKDYWTDCVVPRKGYYYENDPDDTIESILIYW